MKRFILLFSLILVSGFVYTQTTEETEGKRKIGVRMFNMYVESAFGDVLAPDLASSSLKPCLDMKALYMHMLPNIPWLGFSFTTQFKYSVTDFPPNSMVPNNLSEARSPKDLTVSAAIQLGPVGLGIDLTGKLNLFYFGSWKMPNINGLLESRINIILEQGIMVNGNGYKILDNGQKIMTQYIIPDGQFRFQWLLKPNKWFGLQLETVLIWIPLLHAGGFVQDPGDAMVLRFNPRLLFYPSVNWSLFAEPRLFVQGLGKNGFPGSASHRLALEFKVGINYNFAWTD